MKLQNAIKAGSGAPDVAQIEYYALPQFALSDSLANLKDFGFDSFADKYTDSTWNSVSLDGGVYALPQDSGPMALFYNKAVFDQYNIAVPTTWDEYVAAAKQLHAADPTKYITNDTGDAYHDQHDLAGGRPALQDRELDRRLDQPAGCRFEEVRRHLEQPRGGWTRLPITSWSDEWYKGLGDGSIATLTIGAWMPGNLESGVAQASGNWRVAPMPTWEKGQAASAENGGGGDAILKQSKNKLAAAGFLQYMNEGDGTQTSIAKGGFPRRSPTSTTTRS